MVTRNIQYTNVCYFRCGFCAFSKGKLAANLRGAPYLVPLDEIVRRVRGGMGARRDGGLPAGRHPPRVHGRVLRERRPSDQGRRAGDPRPRVLGARGLAGSRDPRAFARGLPRAAARPRARIAAGNRRRGARRRGAARHLPGQGDDPAVARRPRRRPSRRAALERHRDVRPRRDAEEPRTSSAASARAAAPVGRLHRIRAAALRSHGGADLPAGPGPPRPDLPRDRPRPRGRAARAPSRHRERAGVLGEARPRGDEAGARRRCERPRRHADERVDLAFRRGRFRAGAAARADGGAHPQRRPRSAAADDALRRAAGGARARLLRRGHRCRSRSTRRSRTRASSLRRGSCGRGCSREPAR